MFVGIQVGSVGPQASESGVSAKLSLSFEPDRLFGVLAA